MTIPHLEHCCCPRCCIEPTLAAHGYETYSHVVRAVGLRYIASCWYVHYRGEPKLVGAQPVKGSMTVSQWNEIVEQYPLAQ